jgi:hypothetical protein
MKEQVLYTSADHLAQGREVSGWHVTEHSAGLTDAQAEALTGLVDQQLEPFTPLPGFPTQDQIARADRRLVHLARDGGSVLLHTAPAGLDTTGRPNTVTHIVQDMDEDSTRTCLGVRTWRADWWCTPFGPEQVREARLPGTDVIDEGPVVTFDSTAALLADPAHAAVVVALAEAIAGRHGLVLLVVESVDQAAQYIGALLRMCLPQPARELSWSLLQRIHGPGALDVLRRRGLDVVCTVPEDLENLPARGADIDVVDSRDPGPLAPTTPFGRFVAAMTADLGVWVSAVEAIDEVSGLLPDHRGTDLAWGAAMAQVLHPGLLEATFEGDIDPVVDGVLLGVQVPGLEASLQLREAVEQRFLRMDVSTPQAWLDRFRTLPPDTPPHGILRAMARMYLGSSVRDADWLLREGEPAPAILRRAAAAWSEAEEHAADVATLVERASRSVEDQCEGGRTAEPLLRLLGALQADGVTVPGDKAREMCGLVAHPNLQGELLSLSLTQQDPPVAVRRALAAALEQELASADASASSDQGAERTLPFLEEHLVRWLIRDQGDLDLAELPHVNAQVRLLDLVARTASAADALGALAAPEGPKGPVTLTDPAYAALRAALRAEDLDLLGSEDQVIFPDNTLRSAVLVREPEHPRAITEAETMLERAGVPRGSIPDPGLLHSRHIRSAALVALSARPLLTGTTEVSSAVDSARALITAAEEFEQVRALAPPDDLRRLQTLAEARAVAALVIAATVDPEHHPFRAERLTRTAARIPARIGALAASDPALLVALPREGDGGDPFGALCIGALKVLCRPQEPPVPQAAQQKSRRRHRPRADTTADPSVHGTALALLQARATLVPAEGRDAARDRIELALDPFALAPSAEDQAWLTANLPMLYKPQDTRGTPGRASGPSRDRRLPRLSRPDLSNLSLPDPFRRRKDS